MRKLVDLTCRFDVRLSLVLLAGFCVPAVAQQSTDNSDPPANRTGPAYVGMLGAVSQPGVYQFSDTFPGIAQLIRRAGGLADDASGSLRIIRNGQIARETFYSSRLEMELFPGDFVVAESRSTGSQGSRVYVGLANLIDRPVVVPMRPEQATLRQIVRILNQSSEETLSTVQVLRPGSPPQRGASSPEAVDQRLRSGTVLLFNPAVIRRESIPPLPGVYRTEQLLERFPNAPSDDDEHSSGVNSRSTEAAINDPTAEVETAPSAPAEDTADGPLFARPRKDDRLTSSPPPVPDASMAQAGDDKRTRDQATSESRSADSPSIGDPGSPGSSTKNSSPASPSAQGRTKSQENEEERGSNDEGSSDPSSLSAYLSSFTDIEGLVVAVIGTVVALAALILLMTRSRRSHPAATGIRRPSRSASDGNSLDALIRNALPLIEEPLRLPQPLRLYGSPARRKTIRIDAAHPTETPSYDPTDAAPQSEIAESEASPTPIAPHRRKDDEHRVPGPLVPGYQTSVDPSTAFEPQDANQGVNAR